MTRKHFEAIARAMRALRPTDTSPYESRRVWRAHVNALADLCAEKNKLFDRPRFLAACGADGAA